jgi:uncharacterized membrane protein
VLPRVLTLPSITLAQAASGAARGGSGSVVVVLGLIASMILFVIIAGVVLVKLRKRSTQSDEESSGLMLEDLRRLKAAGRLSELEYETLRRSMTEKSIEKMDAKRAARSKQTPTGVPPPLPTTAPGESRVRNNVRKARPGFDLTGEPLPKTPPTE